MLLLSVNSSLASDSENLVFILDASGSMWGHVESKHKIVIAKQVMTELIQELPSGLNTGLVAYGHRRKGDCNNVEELVPLGPLDKERMIEIIKAINPKGKTPITHSIQITAERLKAQEDETTIVLVSDGKETCDGDPCGLVKELKKTGIKIVLHVIGFDVSDAEREQLKCIAESGGGTYFTANTAKQFSMAARKIMAETKYKGSYLKIFSVKNSKPFSASVDVFPAGGDEYIVHGLTPEEFKLLPGTYDIRVKDRDVPGEPTVWIRGVEVKAGLKEQLTAEFTDGRLEITAQKNGKPFSATVDIFPAGEEEYAAYGLTPKEFSLLPGIYDISVKDRDVPGEPTVWIRGVEVEPGKKVERSAEFVDGQMMVIALSRGQSVSVEVDIFPAGEEDYIAWGLTPKGFRLLPGIYDVRVKDRSVPQEPVVWVRGVEVKAGDKINVDAKF